MAGSAWATATLGEVIELKRGYDLPSRDRRDGPYPIVSSSGVSGYHAEAKAKAPGVVTGRYGTLGEVHYITQDYWPLNTSLYVRDFKGNDPRFISYFLRSLDFTAYSDKAAVPGLNRNDLHTAMVHLPPINEQRAIAHILGTLDDKIELNRRTNETLEAIARALFKSWFVDFDPVRAKAEGRDPGLPAHLADLFPDSFEDSELGEIPKGWHTAAVSDLADVNARTLGRTDPLDAIDYVEISEVTRGQVANIVRYERGTEPSRARRRLTHGDTVLSTVRPDRGAYFLCLNPPKTLIASTGFAVVSPRDGNWAFLYSALTRSEVGGELGRLADGGAYPAVRPEAVGGLRLVSPQGSETRSAFDELARPLYERSEQNRMENRLLTALRDSLLPRLISGELRVLGAAGRSESDGMKIRRLLNATVQAAEVTEAGAQA